MDLFTAAGLAALVEVIAINLVLSGDNAIVIGLAAAGLPADMRKKAILFGIAAATVLRLIFAAVTSYLLGIVGLHHICFPVPDRPYGNVLNHYTLGRYRFVALVEERTNCPRKSDGPACVVAELHDDLKRTV